MFVSKIALKNIYCHECEYIGKDCGTPKTIDVGNAKLKANLCKCYKYNENSIERNTTECFVYSYNKHKKDGWDVVKEIYEQIKNQFDYARDTDRFADCELSLLVVYIKQKLKQAGIEVEDE